MQIYVVTLNVETYICIINFYTMKIGEAIQQKKFTSEFQKVAINIAFTSNWLMTNHQTRIKKFGITPQQFNILRILRGQYPKAATVNLLIDRMLDKSSNASRLVEKLRVKGFVERVICPDDRRAVDVIITKAGLKLLSQLDGHMETWEEDLKSISVSEAKQLNILLDKLRTKK